MLNGLQVSWNGDIYVLDSLNTPLFHSDEITPAVQGLVTLLWLAALLLLGALGGYTGAGFIYAQY